MKIIHGHKNVHDMSKTLKLVYEEIKKNKKKAIMGNNPSYFKGKNNHVECVIWFEAKEFCDRLNYATKSARPAGYRFDLLTEAQ